MEDAPGQKGAPLADGGGGGGGNSDMLTSMVSALLQMPAEERAAALRPIAEYVPRRLPFAGERSSPSEPPGTAEGSPSRVGTQRSASMTESSESSLSASTDSPVARNAPGMRGLRGPRGSAAPAAMDAQLLGGEGGIRPPPGLHESLPREHLGGFAPFGIYHPPPPTMVGEGAMAYPYMPPAASPLPSTPGCASEGVRQTLQAATRLSRALSSIRSASNEFQDVWQRVEVLQRQRLRSQPAYPLPQQRGVPCSAEQAEARPQRPTAAALADSVAAAEQLGWESLGMLMTAGFPSREPTAAARTVRRPRRSPRHTADQAAGEPIRGNSDGEATAKREPMRSSPSDSAEEHDKPPPAGDWPAAAMAELQSRIWQIVIREMGPGCLAASPLATMAGGFSRV